MLKLSPNRLSGLILLGSAMLLMLACSREVPRTYPVSGTVTLDGKPLAGVGVMLQPKLGGSFGYGESNADGTFTISTFEIGDGAIPGEHGVIIKDSASAVFPGGFDDTIAAAESEDRPNIPIRYRKVDTSGFSVEVNSRLEPLELNLVSK